MQQGHLRTRQPLHVKITTSLVCSHPHPSSNETMEHRRTTRIPKPMPLGDRHRCRTCAPRPRVSYSTAISPSRCHPARPSHTVPIELAPGPEVLETVQNVSHDGTTDASVQWQIPYVGAEQQQIQDLSSIRVISPDGDNTPPPVGDVSGDDSASRSHPFPVVS